MMPPDLGSGRQHDPQGEIRPAEEIHIDDIIQAAKNDDTLSIELIEEAGEKVGKAAFLINTFNPETVIVGGNLAAAATTCCR